MITSINAILLELGKIITSSKKFPHTILHNLISKIQT